MSVSAGQRKEDGIFRIAWVFAHEPRGTCEEDCPSYGHCHCGCGRKTRRSLITDKNRRQRKGRPYVFSPGHHMRLFHPRAGAYSKAGVEVERVRPLIMWLRTQHGTMRGVAHVVRIPESTLRGYAYKQELQRVPPEAAKKIIGAVLTLRPGSMNRSMWG